MLWLCFIVAVVIAVILSVYIIRYKKQLNDVVDQIEFIRENDSNLRLELFLQSNELKNLVKQINSILDEKREDKVASNKAEKEFKVAITNVSHDLRTPLTSIVGYIDMLKNQESTIEDNEDYLEIVRGRVQYLVQMLDHLFEFARIESGEYMVSREKVDIVQTFVETLYLFYHDFSKKKAEPQLDIPDVPVYILGDKDILRRIFENLIKNAFVHGEGDLHVSIEQINDYASIYVQNYAPNLNEQDTQRLFDRFYTSDPSRHRKTTGLGLSITKRLVELLDGKVHAYKKGENLVIVLEFKLIRHS